MNNPALLNQAGMELPGFGLGDPSYHPKKYTIQVQKP